MGKKRGINPFKTNQYEIIYEIINAGLYGAGVFVGAVVGAGDITLKGVGIACLSALGIAINRFYSYISSEKKEYTTKRKHLLTFW